MPIGFIKSSNQKYILSTVYATAESLPNRNTIKNGRQQPNMKKIKIK